MSDGLPDSLIPYDEIVQEALRAVVGRVLGQVAAEGLPGEHHFYITFKTQAPGVDIPQRLIERQGKMVHHHDKGGYTPGSLELPKAKMRQACFGCAHGFGLVGRPNTVNAPDLRQHVMRHMLGVEDRPAVRRNA